MVLAHNASGSFKDFLFSEARRRSIFLTSSAAERLSGRIPGSKSDYVQLVIPAFTRTGFMTGRVPGPCKVLKDIPVPSPPLRALPPTERILIRGLNSYIFTEINRNFLINKIKNRFLADFFWMLNKHLLYGDFTIFAIRNSRIYVLYLDIAKPK